MELLSTDDFAAWLAPRDITIKQWGPAYNSDYIRFWCFPQRAACLPYFLHHVLSGFGPWSSCCMWLRDGGWYYESATDAGPKDRVHLGILGGAGVPFGAVGALKCSDTEVEKVLAIGFAQMSFGWSQSDDLFLIPDHGRAVIEINHHDVVHVNFANADDVQPFVDYMATEEYELPKKPPDGTFMWEQWMTDVKT